MNSLMKIFTVFAWFTLIAVSDGFAGDVTFTSRISYRYYGDIVVDKNTPNGSNSVWTNPGTGAYQDLNIRDYITLGIDHELREYLGEAYDIEVDLLVTPSSNGNLQASFTQTLSIGYHPYDQESYQDKDIYRFTNADHFTYQISNIRIITGTVTNSVDELPKNVFIDGDIVVNRVGDFTSVSTTPVGLLTPELHDLDCDPSTPADVLRIKWQSVAPAIEYQLEWTFVNDYEGTIDPSSPSGFGQLDADELKYDFRHNSTRITTENSYYDIPMVFENGYLLWRVRAVGVNFANQPVFGVWSHPYDRGRVDNNSSFPGLPGFISQNPNGYIQNVTAHELNKNWQLTTTFAEEGKKKEVISYYDGSLRNRQSVTVVNTDDNVIVGETIYDHQGRPSINVLPVPVVKPNCGTTSGDPSQASIRYYDNFNKVSSTEAYRRENFDLESGSCDNSLAPMDNSSGAAQYYSDQNPNKEGHQAYVPDAGGYPFTQVEYTPDNTGRIRRQSGVGSEFQLGSGHESKYFYGKPYQINLDRLFASEVGYAAHYKKNLVVDPNGQVSVSYLDQEGRVVATALAGEVPENLESIKSVQDLIADGGTNLEVDLFEKDANGMSSNNIPNVTNDGIEFSQEILVSTEGLYHFVYNLSHDAYTEECTPNLCYNCVYDLKLSLLDECATVLNESVLMEGHFEKNGEEFSTFTTLCKDGGAFESDIIDFTVDLDVGNYTLVKTLTINNNAIAYAFQAYLEAGQESDCINSFEDFHQEEIDNIDLSGCDIGCEECQEKLGLGLDQFIVQGFGTVEDFEALEAECELLCNEPTFCETMAELLKADMSPGGQYGEYQVNGTNSASSYPLSVYNTNNVLPFNSFSGAAISENWKNPLVVIDGITYDYYLNDLGDSAKVYLSVIGSGLSASISPAVSFYNDSPNDDVIYDAQLGVYYTYPDRLASVYDFIEEFQYSWSQSLVIYHPEYKYYETCLTYGNEDANGNSSESFDQLMKRTTTFADALSANLLEPNGNVPDYGDINAIIYDPFITSSSNYGGFGNTLRTQLLTYQTIGTEDYSMQDFAAIMVRCGNGSLSGNTSTLDVCKNLWGDYAGGTTPTVTNDEEWNAFKSLYLGKKRELQSGYEDVVALDYGNPQNHLNDCIGNSNFNQYTSGMYQWSPTNTYSNPYYNSQNACSINKIGLYQGKTKRFPDSNDYEADANPSNAAYQSYLQSGQCPNAVNLQNVLNEIANSNNDNLNTGSIDLLDYPSYGILYGGAFAYDFSDPLPQMFWNTLSDLNGILKVELVEGGSSSACALNLNSNGQLTDWTTIESFSGLSSTGLSSSGLYEFEIVANLSNGQHLTFTGETCLNIADCQFEEVCEPNDLAVSIEKTMSTLAENGQLINSSYALPNTGLYNQSVSIQLLNQLGASTNNQISWMFTGSNNVAKFVNGTNVLELVFNSSTPTGFNGFSSINHFDNIQSEHQHYFSVDAFDTANNLLVHLEGEALFSNDGGANFVAVSMGDCGLPDPISCSGDEFELRENLQNLLGDVLLSQNYNIYQSSQITSLMEGYLGNGISSNGTTSNLTEDGITYEFLDLLIHDASNEVVCEINLNFENTGSLSFSNIISVESLKGVAPLQGNSFHDFEMEVLMDVNGVEQAITVYGTSCIPLKNCQLCEDIIDLPIDSSDYEGGGDKIDPENLYGQLVQAIDNLNQREGWTDGSPEYVTPPSIKYTVENNQIYVFEEYIKFIENYDASLDNSIYLYDINKFYAEYGYRTNVEKEYERYEKSILAYNQRAVLSGASTLTPATSTEFAESKVANYNNEYIDYIKTEPQTTGYAKTIEVYLTEEGKINPYATLSPCEVLYQNYVTAYKNFYNNSTLSEKELKVCHELNPLISFEVWKRENLCCSSTGLNLLQDYIDAFANLNECPDQLPGLKDCTDPKVELGKECQRSYELYLEEIKKYNQTPYAQGNGHVLIPITSADFLSHGYCDCIKDYLKYLEEFIHYSEGVGPNAENIDEFGPCNKVEDDCASKYDDYNETVAAYNHYVKENGREWPIIESKYKPSQFITEGLCYCVDGYVAYLNALMSGVITNAPTKKDIYIEQHCEKAPCVPDAVPMLDTITPLVIEFGNPCEEQAYNIAQLNAEIAYQAYVNTLATAFTDSMRTHCLRVTENFTMDFNELEYHYTLYYYDQAGNLIKTVPPEGVEIINTTMSSDPISQAIIADRTNKTQTVFTSHRLATKYKYNSLNQLTHQSLPDHDQMNIIDLGLVDGLDPELVVESIQFVNDNIGYLSGHVKYQGKDRGLLYSTNDGGQTWQKVENLLGSDLQSVQWIDGTGEAYAVGSKGILIHTIDGGYSWDMVNTYTEDVTAQLNDLTVNSSLFGYAVGEQSTIMEINGNTVSSITPVVNNSTYTLDGNDHITSITEVSGTYYITVDYTSVTGEQFGMLYRSSNGTNWEALPLVSVNQLTKVQAIDANNYVAIGENGTFLKSIDGGNNWFVQHVDIKEDFNDIYFSNPTKGISIRDNGRIWATQDGGSSWSLLDPLLSFNHFYAYGLDQVLAYGDNGSLGRVIMGAGTSFGIIEMDAPINGNIEAAWAEMVSGQLKVIVSSGNNNLHLTNNAYLSNPFWNVLATGAGTIAQIEAADFGGEIRGVIQNASGALYGFEYGGAGYSDSFVPSTLTGYLALCKDNSNNEFIVYNSSNGGEIKSLNGSIGLPTTLTTLATIGTYSLDNLSIDPTGNNYLLSGMNGTIVSTVNNSGSFTTTEQTNNVRPLNWTDAAILGNTLTLVGDNGSINQFDVTSSTNQSKLTITEDKENFNAISSNSTTGVLVGDHGVARQVQSSGIVGSIASNTIQDLLSVAVDENSTNAYFGSNTGQLFRTTDYTSGATLNPINSSSNEPVNGIHVDDNGVVSYVGGNSHIYQGGLGMAYQIKSVYTPELKDVHFSSIMNGYALGEDYTLRHTSDGGETWTAILPNSGFTGGNIPALKGVQTLNNSEAIVIGENGFAAKANNSTTTVYSSGIPNVGYSLNDIEFSDASHGVIVGGDNTGKVWLTSNGGTSWSEVSSIPSGINGLNGVHGFNNNTFMAVGDGESVLFIENSSNVLDFTTSTPSPSESLYDVYFYDDVNGYAVGTNGMIIRSVNASFTVNGTLANLEWEDLPVVDTYGSSNKDIYTIDFANRYQGVLGGEQIGGGNGSNYARSLRDESGEFSTKFWYDRLGRIVVSQNSKQYNTGTDQKRFSYTLYDELGRVVEAGEKVENTTLNNQHKDIFGTYVSGLYNPKVIDDTKLRNWITDNAGIRQEVTHSYYDYKIDNPEIGISSVPGFAQNELNLRKRISAVTYEKVYDGNNDTYSYGTFYEYDIHGNVKTLIQHNKELAVNPTTEPLQYKRMDYDYDLISGNVHEVAYQEGEADAWYHKYEYDGDNRIVSVETSEDRVTWDRDAHYIYYDHGPLARVELGEHNVQGVDYAYTLQGWLKGVNSDLLNPNNDIGEDGVTWTSGAPNPNEHFARDAFGFSLMYYQNDYSPIDYANKWQQNSSRFASVFQPNGVNSDALLARENLYNGNISAMVSTITEPTLYASTGATMPTIMPQATAYKYDQLNRLLKAHAYQNVDMDVANIDPDNSVNTYNTWGYTGTYDSTYYNGFVYDASGNILHQSRYDHLGNQIENLRYHYGTTGGANGKLLQNRLYSVSDFASAADEALYDDDIEDMGFLGSAFADINNGSENYQYDAIGQLIQDRQEGINEILWRVDGKISAIIRDAGSDAKNIVFDYDPMGNRIAKHVYGNESYPVGSTDNFDPENPTDWEKTTYYNRDAQGNVMAIYEYFVDESSNSTKFSLSERYIYGSSRVGMSTDCKEMIAATTSSTDFDHTLGMKRYELTNHLGNVLSVVTDRKHPIDESGDMMIDYYQPEITMATDYSPFGVELYERSFNRTEVMMIDTDEQIVVQDEDDFSGYTVNAVANGWTHVYGTGKVTSQEEYYIKGQNGGGPPFAYGLKILAIKDWSNQLVVGEEYEISFDVVDKRGSVTFTTANGTGGIGTSQIVGPAGSTFTVSFTASSTDGSFNLAALGINIGNTFITIDNLQLKHKTLIQETCTASVGSYRHTFQGQEKDDEIRGGGNSLNFTYRMYDPRIGRFFTIDPLTVKYPHYSPYQFAGNKVVSHKELEGLEESATNSGSGTSNSEYNNGLMGVIDNPLSDNNLVIWIADPHHKGFDEEKMSGMLKGWDAIIVKDPAAAAEWMTNNIEPGSLDNVIFRTHGSSGSVWVGDPNSGFGNNGDYYNEEFEMTADKIDAFMGSGESESQFATETMNSMAKIGTFIKDGGNILMTACNCDNIRPVSGSVGALIFGANKTGYIYTNKDLTTSRDEVDGVVSIVFNKNLVILENWDNGGFSKVKISNGTSETIKSEFNLKISSFGNLIESDKPSEYMLFMQGLKDKKEAKIHAKEFQRLMQQQNFIE